MLAVCVFSASSVEARTAAARVEYLTPGDGGRGLRRSAVCGCRLHQPPTGRRGHQAPSGSSPELHS